MDKQYEYCPLKPIITVNKIYTIHYFKYCKQFDIVGEKHNFWEIVYIDAGEVGVIANEKALSLKQGEAIFHKPNEYHNICTEDNFANSVIVSFECNSKAMSFFKDKVLILSEYEKDLLSKIVLEGKENYEEKLNEVNLLKMTKRKNAPLGGEQIIKNNLELLLISLIRNNSSASGLARISESVNIKHSNELVNNIINILKANIYTNINLTSLSKQLLLSKSYMKTIFSAQTKTSIIQYYIKLKLDEAKKLISQNNLTFSEIAFRLDFTSVQYFSRLFKKHTGMTPSEYAKTIKIEKVLD